MSDIKITIEGQGAVAAAEALMNLPGISGSWTSQEDVRRDGALEIIATIVTIASGAMSMGEQIRKWHEEYSGSEENKIENVVIITPKKRIAIEDATPEEIAQLLKEVTKPSEQ